MILVVSPIFSSTKKLRYTVLLLLLCTESPVLLHACMDTKFPVYSLECPTLVDLIKAGDIIYVYDGSKTSRTKNTEEQNERLKEQSEQ